MFGLPTFAQQQLILSQQAQIMSTLKDLTDAVTATKASTDKLIALIPPAATELTDLRNQLAQAQPTLDATTATLLAATDALDEASATLTAVVANQPAG